MKKIFVFAISFICMTIKSSEIILKEVGLNIYYINSKQAFEKKIKDDSIWGMLTLFYSDIENKCLNLNHLTKWINVMSGHAQDPRVLKFYTMAYDESSKKGEYELITSDEELKKYIHNEQQKKSFLHFIPIAVVYDNSDDDADIQHILNLKPLCLLM